MKKNKGFTLTESLIVLAIIGVVMGTIYMMILHFRDVSGAEQARTRQTQETRFLFTSFATEVRNAGSIITLAHPYALTYGIIDAKDTNSFIFFNGIFPLNNTNFPDGIIVATGDPNCVGMLQQAGNPLSDGALVLDPTFNPRPAWQGGDIGLVCGRDGYSVFHVTQFNGSDTISISNTPIYYSGLLNTAHYQDLSSTVKGKTGNTIQYPVGSIVTRISSFSIYLMQEIYDSQKHRNVRQLVRITDTKGQSDVLATGSTALKSVIAQNIWDMQIVYNVYAPLTMQKTTYFSTEVSPNSSDLKNLLGSMDNKYAKEIIVNLLVLTDDYPGRGKLPSTNRLIKAFGDLSADYTLPSGKYTYRQFALTILPKNFTIGFTNF